jgi:hypothetical protein
MGTASSRFSKQKQNYKIKKHLPQEFLRGSLLGWEMGLAHHSSFLSPASGLPSFCRFPIRLSPSSSSSFPQGSLGAVT